jgi:predicted dehydrogenase
MINLGIIGVGYWDPNLVRDFAQLREANILGVCDLKEENALRSFVPHGISIILYLWRRDQNLALLSHYARGQNWKELPHWAEC